MDIVLVETLQLIIERYGDRTQGSVFIPIRDFPWYKERNGQLTRLYAEGYITSPKFYDDGAEVTLTQAGRHFFDSQEGSVVLTKDKIYEILVTLKGKMEIPKDHFGYEKREANGIIQQLQNERLIAGAIFAEGGKNKAPLIVWLDRAYITMKGLDFIESYEARADKAITDVDLRHEFIVACAKIADNPASYASFDEDGLNREVRNFVDSAICRFGYTVADQTQQGFGKTDKKAGELDIRISKNGIPVAIYEGLIHSTKQYRDDHIKKAIEKYNRSGCKAVYVVEFSRNKGFGGFWDNAIEGIEENKALDSIREINTELLGIRMLEGSFNWEGQQGLFFFIGVNCYTN